MLSYHYHKSYFSCYMLEVLAMIILVLDCVSHAEKDVFITMCQRAIREVFNVI